MSTDKQLTAIEQLESIFANQLIEIRKCINFPSCYITSNGQVYNHRGMRLSDYNNRGYRAINLKNDKGKRLSIGLHRLVVEAFIGPIPPKHWVNHKNGVKHDNRVENLEITTPKQNHEHARDVLKRKYASGETLKVAKLNIPAVEAIRLLSSLGWSQYKIAEAFLVSQPAISNILNRVTWDTSDVRSQRPPAQSPASPPTP